ncbi:LOW QUALITY PROTEIN: metallophosphoesterase 1-like [Haliotis rubra]|uniref:LOW QUALITY PROTEIN: metallophosphoesterase 1-like n=1 Tax=Haliotis rubra TaxID=36100 RepID=UPI001EE628E1|nr:LOW QUALITY PROTEIN: metallophosphoesterase 1-like [Haliotis rubra]
MGTMRRSLCSRLRNLTFRSFLLLLVLTTVIINEFLVHRIQSWRWPAMPHPYKDSEEEMRILFVSDPQIIGYQDESMFPIGSLTRWDSDSFLSRTFSLAFSYAQPDVVVFLGDLMDEGSRATPAEYEIYMDRIESIFYSARHVKKIFVPGDNDIGGEGRDFRSPFKIARFENHFENLTGIERVGFIDFIKLDLRFNRDMPLEQRKLLEKLKKHFTAPLRLIVNHETMLPKLKSFIHPILMEVQPHLLMSGHWHEVSLGPVSGSIEVGLVGGVLGYGVGEPSMGYRVGLIDPEGHVKYTVLWLPSRYIQLYAYLGVLVLVAILFISCCIMQSLWQQQQPRYPR